MSNVKTIPCFGPNRTIIEMPIDEWAKKIEIGSIFKGTAYFDWCAPNGFGQFSFEVNPETQEIGIASECMGPETSRRLLYAFVDKIIENGVFD